MLKVLNDLWDRGIPREIHTSIPKVGYDVAHSIVSVVEHEATLSAALIYCGLWHRIDKQMIPNWG